MSDNIGSSAKCFDEGKSLKNDEQDNDEVEIHDTLGKKTECRICGEEDIVMHMEAPCACNGTLKHAHRKCIQKWCNEKNDTICEICNKNYDGYTVAQEETGTEQLLLEDYETELRNAVIRTLILISGAIMVMIYAYDLEIQKRDLGDKAFAFSSSQVFLVQLMAVIMPICALYRVIQLVIIWRERRNRQTRRLHSS